MKKYSVYIHTTPSNKVYIGITSQKVERRWRKGVGYISTKHFWRAIQKYGWDNIKHEVLYTGLSEEEAKVIEMNLISQYESRNPIKGYNITEGGDTRVVSVETIQKIAEKNRGKKRTKEQLQRYKEAAKKREKRPCLTEEWKANISKSLIGNKRATGNKANSKPIYQLDLNGNIVAYYKYGAKQASLILGCDNSGISKACKENTLQDVSKTKYKGKYLGYRWVYENQVLHGKVG